MIKRKMLIAGMSGLALTAGSVAFGATAFAATPAPAVFKACVTDKTGAMYQVSTTTTKCARGQHLITWNQAGIAGAKGATGATGAAGKAGLNGKDGKPGLNGKDGVNGKDGLNGNDGAPGKDGQDGADGAPGADGKDGAPGSKVVAGDGNATGEITAALVAGDFYFDRTTGTLWEYDGSAYGSPVVLKGADGKNGTNGTNGADGKDGADGADGADGTKILAGDGAASDEIKAALVAGDFYLDRTAGTLAQWDGTGFVNSLTLKGKDGADGKDGLAGKDGVDGTNGTDGKNGVDGKSVTVKRETVDPDANGFTLTFTCADGETAIGAGYTGVTGQLTGSNAGTALGEWVLTFDPSADLSGATGTAICTALV